MALWKVHCAENYYPGLWHRWYRHQCVAIGWPPPKWKLDGKNREKGLSTARNAINRMKPGDIVIVSLQGNRVGRLGEITGFSVGDDQWDPLVPMSKDWPNGQMGRRIHVRWDLTCGPTDAGDVVALPSGSRLAPNELLPTISEIRSVTSTKLQKAMNDTVNWVRLIGQFKYERALSDYIATFPHHLEDGLVPHPNTKIRERVFSDKKRLDVLLLDREDKPVIVECKQGAPSVENVRQLRHYMRSLQRESNRKDVRGMLVHGGSQKVHQDVVSVAEQVPVVEIVQYRLQVDFSRSFTS